MLSIRDRWWYLKYCWHRWRLERAHIALCDHMMIIEGHLGVDLGKVRIKKHPHMGVLVPPKEGDK